MRAGWRELLGGFWCVLILVAASCRAPHAVPSSPSAVVYITDFGLRDGAVSAMKGVACGVDARLVLEDLTHEIEPFNVWEAAYRLRQTASYWPATTVFVCVIDPGVGTARRSVVARLESGQLFVTPDNGTLTLVTEDDPVVELREISAAHRVPGSERSATFHGRDIYSLTGALLASGRLAYREVGPSLDPKSLVRLDYPRSSFTIGNGEHPGFVARGMIPVLDSNFGNIWTNLPATGPFRSLEVGTALSVRIAHGDREIFFGSLPWSRSFGDVPLGEPLVYTNSLGNVALALHRDSFAERFGISAGLDWTVTVELSSSIR